MLALTQPRILEGIKETLQEHSKDPFVLEQLEDVLQHCRVRHLETLALEIFDRAWRAPKGCDEEGWKSFVEDFLFFELQAALVNLRTAQLQTIAGEELGARLGELPEQDQDKARAIFQSLDESDCPPIVIGVAKFAFLRATEPVNLVTLAVLLRPDLLKQACSTIALTLPLGLASRNYLDYLAAFISKDLGTLLNHIEDGSVIKSAQVKNCMWESFVNTELKLAAKEAWERERMLELQRELDERMELALAAASETQRQQAQNNVALLGSTGGDQGVFLAGKHSLMETLIERAAQKARQAEPVAASAEDT